MKRILVALIIAVVSPLTLASGWSDWLIVKQLRLHPDWGFRVEFEEIVYPECGSDIAEWSAAANEVFMNRVVSSLLAAKFAKAKVRVWVSSCNGEIALVNQTQIQ